MPEIPQTNSNEIDVNESQLRTGQSCRIIGAQALSPQKSSDSSSVKKVINDFESPNETEGRQLRKRIKTTDANESTRTPRSGDISKIEDDEDGEIYEVDFSGLVPQQNETNVGEARQRLSAALTGGGNTTNDVNTNVNSNSVSASPSSRAIVASTLAYHSIGVSQSTPSQINTTRTLRRSTSSHGSASTQSMTGENGIESGPDGMQRRKGPGRTPTWMKEQESMC